MSISAATSAALAAAARQMSVDAEAIKIVIHDVDDRTPRRVSLRRDPNDKGHRCKSVVYKVENELIIPVVTIIVTPVMRTEIAMAFISPQIIRQNCR